MVRLAAWLLLGGAAASQADSEAAAATMAATASSSRRPSSDATLDQHSPQMPWGSPTVGTWTGSQLPHLPQTSSGNLPHSPMLGNGYLGAMISTNRVGPPLVQPDSARGPAASGNTSINVWMGSNAMWGVYPSKDPSLGPTSKATRRALGGVTLSGLDSLFVDSAPQLVAQQRIMEGVLTTIHSAPQGQFTTRTFISPTSNVLVTNCSWSPSMEDTRSTEKDTAELTVSVFTLCRYADCCPPGQTKPATLPTSAVVIDEQLVVTRDAVPAEIPSARRIKAALALSVTSASDGVSVSARSSQNADPVLNETVAEGFATLRVPLTGAFSFALVTVLQDNLAAPNASSTALAAAAATAAGSADPAAIAQEAAAWWATFWDTSYVHLPTEPEIEALWNGAQYILASSASPAVDKNTPAPGLGGPFVTSDNSGWNGDYTLDYNYEATYYGAYASGHPELAQLYWQPMIDGMAAARRGAQDRAKANNLTMCAPTALHFNAHISPWGYGDFDEHWESTSGQHMMWNGVFGALLFMNDHEYMGANRSAFFEGTTLPLLEGLLDWWACYLTKTPCGPAGTPSCPGSGGYRYDDTKDAVNEGTTFKNSQMALAFVARLADVLRRLPAGQSRSTATAQDIATHLAPFDTAVCISPKDHHTNESVWVNRAGGTVAQSSDFSMYPIFPTEFLSEATATTAQLRTAQSTARVYGDLAGGRPVETFATTVLAGSGLSGFAWTPQQVVDGVKAHMKMHFGPNLLCDTNGGGIENVGMSRAVSEMLVAAPSGKYIRLFPFWPTSVPASFGGLMVKGGFRLWANYSDGAVESPIRLRSIAGAVATLVNPWGGFNASVTVTLDPGSEAEPVAIIGWSTTRAGQAFAFATVAGEDRTFFIAKGAATLAPQPRQSQLPDLACTQFSSNCTACMAARDTRAAWASACVYLSGPSESGARCQPSKWWFPPYDSAKLYPKVHACSTCPAAGACPVLPPPPPAPPPPPGVCPIKQLCQVEMESACGAAKRKGGEPPCVACMKANSAVLTTDGCTTDAVVAFCSK